MIQFDSNLIFSYGHIIYFYANMIKVNKKNGSYSHMLYSYKKFEE